MKFTPAVGQLGRVWAEWLFSVNSQSPTAASLRHRNLKERGGRASLSLSFFSSSSHSLTRFGLDFKFTLQEKPSTSIGQIFMVSKMLSCFFLFCGSSVVVEVLLFFQRFSVRTYQTPQTHCISSFHYAAPRCVIQISWNFITSRDDVCIYFDHWIYGATGCSSLAMCTYSAFLSRFFIYRRNFQFELNDLMRDDEEVCLIIVWNELATKQLWWTLLCKFYISEDSRVKKV